MKKSPNNLPGPVCCAAVFRPFESVTINVIAVRGIRFVLVSRIPAAIFPADRRSRQVRISRVITIESPNHFPTTHRILGGLFFFATSITAIIVFLRVIMFKIET